MKFIFVLFQAYLLFINTVFAQNDQLHELGADEVFYSINLAKLTQISKELVKMQKDPSMYLAGFKNNKVKDYKNFAQKVKQNEQMIKEVKVVMQEDVLQISHQKQVLSISEISPFNNTMVINGKDVIWNPKTDTFDDLHNRLTSILGVKEKTGFINFLIPNAEAFIIFSPLVWQALVVSVGFVGFLGLGMGVGETIKQKEIKKLEAKKNQLANALKRCDSDLVYANEIKKTIGINEKFNNDTLKFLRLLKSQNKIKPLKFANCKIITEKQKENESQKEKNLLMQEICEEERKLEECLPKYIKVVGEEIVNSERNIKKLLPSSSYKNLDNDVKEAPTKEK